MKEVRKRLLVQQNWLSGTSSCQGSDEGGLAPPEKPAAGHGVVVSLRNLERYHWIRQNDKSSLHELVTNFGHKL